MLYFHVSHLFCRREGTSEGTSEGPQALKKQGTEFGQESEHRFRETAKKSRGENQYLFEKKSMPCFLSISFYGLVFFTVAA